jgi:hypothetical protein
MKKGSTQIDWIISLAIFLLFISWFFAFMLPQFTFEQNKNSIIEYLKTSFETEFSWSVDKFKLFIESNSSKRFQPIVIDYHINRSDLKFIDGTNHLLWDNKLILLANLTNGVKVYDIVTNTAYNQSFDFYGFDINQNVITTENLSVEFSSSLIEESNYDSETKFDDVEFHINNVEFNPTSNTYFDKGFVGIYVASMSNINLTSMVFWSNQEIYNFVTSLNNDNYTLNMFMNLDSFSSYYSSNANFGEFSYDGAVEEITYSDDYLTLYGDDAITFYFDNNVDINLTNYNDTLTLVLSMPIHDSYQYRIIFHEGNYNNINETNYDARFGAIKTISGIYLDNITTDYTALQTNWKINQNFQINVFQNYSVYQHLYDPKYIIGTFDPGTKSVFGESIDMFSLNSDGELVPINVNYRIW